MSPVRNDVKDLRWEQPVPVVFESPQTGLDTDSTGVKFTSELITVPSEMLDVMTHVGLEASWTASETDSVTDIELRDEDAGTVIDTVSGNAGQDQRSFVGAGNLTAGNKLAIRVNVTTISGAAGTVDLEKALAVFRYNMSVGPHVQG